MTIKENENLISIDDLIARAKRLGVDFGKGNPRNRLRYYTKIGLLPHAQRKCFENNYPEGAYPESVLDLLVEIDKKIKEGKSIQTIKREFAEKKTKEKKEEEALAEKEVIKEVIGEETEEKPTPKLTILSFLSLKTLLIIIILGLIVFSMSTKVNTKNLTTYFLAAINNAINNVKENAGEVTQIATPEEFPSKIFLIESPYEPYLTINAETDISRSLKVKEKITTPILEANTSITTPILNLKKGNFEGKLKITDLTKNQEYIFPNLSGTVCLSTGNCVGLGGETIAVKGIANRLSKFISSNKISPSSIADFYTGLALTIDDKGRIGIGTTNPQYKLHVQGKIQATGDICTDLEGGKCLSQLTKPQPQSQISYIIGGSGISGSGSAGYLPVWTGDTTLGNSIVFQDGDLLDIAGTIKMTGFQLPTGAQEGYILTSDASGIGTWQPAPTGTLPSGIAGQTLRYDGTNWVANSFLYNTGSAIGIGTTSTLATLTLAGDAVFQGSLTLATTTSPQLLLKYNDQNYLNFSIASTSSEILASKTMTLNSLTGEIKLWNTSIEQGERILRSSIPIFNFPVPAETASTSFVAVTKKITPTILDNSTPNSMPGSQREYAFLINFADNIPTSSSSTWQIDYDSAEDTQFEFAGQDMSELDEGNPHLSDPILLESDNWQLEVRVPSGNKIRIFNIFLLVFDKIQ